MTTHFFGLSNQNTDPLLTAEDQAPQEGDMSPRSPKRVTIHEDPLHIASPPEDDNRELLTKQLFGSDLEEQEIPSCNDLIVTKWREWTRKGLPADQREFFLGKYSPPEPIVFLRAPALNQECRVALKNNTIVKKDDFATKNQNQVGIALCALGEALSDLLCPETQNSLNLETRLAISKVNDGAKLLADLFYRLSLTRRALTVPALNLTAKNTADTIPIDELLFDSSTADQTTSSNSIIQGGKRPCPCATTQSGDEESRSDNQQSPTAIPLQIPTEEALGGNIEVNSAVFKMDQPGPSTEIDQLQIDEEREKLLQTEDFKGELTNAVKYCNSLLEAEHLLTDTLPDKISSVSVVMGEMEGNYFRPANFANHSGLQDPILTGSHSYNSHHHKNRNLQSHYPTHKAKFVPKKLIDFSIEELLKGLQIVQDCLYQFKVLPFGLASAPYIFTRILKPVVHSFREKGLFLVIYLDDFLLMADSYEQCMRNIKMTTSLLSSLGFIINKRKSVLAPTNTCKYLGFIFDSRLCSIMIPPDRRENLLRMTLVLLKKKRCKIRLLAIYIGSLISVCPAVQYGLLHTKVLEREKFLDLTASEDNFEAQIPLPVSIREDLLWWKSIFADCSQRNFVRSGRWDLEIFSDASLTGWGAVCGEERTHGFWSSEEKQLHINYLELLAVFHALRCFASHIEDANILLRRRSPRLKEDYPGSREIIRRAFIFKGTPPAALTATLASISEATLSQYSKPLKLWWFFCKQNQINCFTPPVSAFLDFLSSLLSNVGSYATLNSYRSAVSLISSNEVGSHPLVSRFFKGVSVLKPQRHRYDVMWDPRPVIERLSSLFPHDKLSLELLSRKLVTLLALTTAQRMQTLASIQLSNIILSDSLVIKISARLKTSRRNATTSIHPDETA
ncbi:uncharacterized protein [Linepithema humile]|uniref:uncharacterized protein n=1 Tax=Linepithema humile TaxID=83485 RepID=UPI00351E74F5